MITLSFSYCFLRLLLVDPECRCSNLLSHHNWEFKEDAPHCFVTEECQFLNFMVYWISMVCCCQVCCSAVSQFPRTGSTNYRVPWGPSRLTFVWLYVEYSKFSDLQKAFSKYVLVQPLGSLLQITGWCLMQETVFDEQCFFSLQIITLKLWKSGQPSHNTTAFLIFSPTFLPISPLTLFLKCITQSNFLTSSCLVFSHRSNIGARL